jgi:hypothetical protein
VVAHLKVLGLGIAGTALGGAIAVWLGADKVMAWLVAAVIGLALVAAAEWRQRRAKRHHIPRLSTEDRAALVHRLLLERAVERDKTLRRVPKRWLRRRFRELEEWWVTADVEAPDCPAVVRDDATWEMEISKVETGVMLTLHCSNWSLLAGIACRVDDQHGMKHRSEPTGKGGRIEVRFKYPNAFDAPPIPREGWHQVSWFHPDDDPETGATDPGFGKEILTCRFRVLQPTNRVISSSGHT